MCLLEINIKIFRDLYSLFMHCVGMMKRLIPRGFAGNLSEDVKAELPQALLKGVAGR